jgi:DNA-binding transcriptional LysR family regulator
LIISAARPPIMKAGALVGPQAAKAEDAKLAVHDGILPEFFLREALESSRLERLLPDWSIPLGAVYWVTPPEGPLPKRVEVLGDHLIEKLARAAVAENHRRAAPR